MNQASYNGSDVSDSRLPYLIYGRLVNIYVVPIVSCLETMM